MEANTRRPTSQAQSKLLCVLQEQSESEGDAEDDEEDMGHDELLELSSTRQVEWNALRFLCFRLDMLSYIFLANTCSYCTATVVCSNEQDVV